MEIGIAGLLLAVISVVTGTPSGIDAIFRPLIGPSSYITYDNMTYFFDNYKDVAALGILPLCFDLFTAYQD